MEPGLMKEQTLTLAAGRSMVVRTGREGEALEVLGADGQLQVEIAFGPSGAIVRLRAARLELEAADTVAVRCQRFELQSAGPLHLEGQELRVRTRDDIHMDGAFIRLNCAPELPPPAEG